jgi:hypothetical protein
MFKEMGADLTVDRVRCMCSGLRIVIIVLIFMGLLRWFINR